MNVHIHANAGECNTKLCCKSVTLLFDLITRTNGEIQTDELEFALKKVCKRKSKNETHTKKKEKTIHISHTYTHLKIVRPKGFSF